GVERDFGLTGEDRVGAQDATQVRERVTQRMPSPLVCFLPPEHVDQHIAAERSRRERENREQRELPAPPREIGVLRGTLQGEATERDQSARGTKHAGPRRGEGGRATGSR